MNCNFDNELCSVWSNVNGDDFDWTRHRGSTGSSSTGPNADHTTGSSSGYYMYIEANSHTEGDIATLSSTEIEWGNDVNMCLQFW